MSGARLYRHGVPYRFVGANLYYAMHLGAAGKGSQSDGRERLVRELDRLAAMGVTNVRAMASSEGPDDESLFARAREGVGLSDVWSLGRRPTPWRVVPSLQPAPGVYNEDVMAGLDFLIAHLGVRNMTCVLMLSNMWPWSGGFAQYVAWAESSDIPYMPPEPDGDWDRFQTYASRFYRDPAARAAFLAHTQVVLTRTNSLTGVRYADDPAIMAWQLANEPRPMKAVEAFRGWLDESSELIKRLAPRQLLTIGSEGRTPFARSYVGINFQQDHAHPRVDYCTAHVWPQNWGWYQPEAAEATYAHALNRSLAYVRDHAEMASAVGKPLVIEEFGLARDANRHVAGTSVAWRDRFYSDLFGEVVRLASFNERSVVQGANFWAWGGEGRPRRPRAPDETFAGAHCWAPGDALLGDPPHEAAGWYSVFEDDVSTHHVIANASAALASLPSDR